MAPPGRSCLESRPVDEPEDHETPWVVTGRLQVSARWATFSHGVTPPHGCHVRFRKRDCSVGDHLLKLVNGMKIFPGGDWKPTFPRDSGMTGHVVRNGWLLQPGKRLYCAMPRAARIASSTRQRMFASAIRGKSSPRWLLMGRDPLDVF